MIQLQQARLSVDYVDPADSHTIEILKEVSLRTKNFDVIWPGVAPVVRVMSREGKYFIWDIQNDFRLDDDALPPLAKATNIRATKSDATYAVRGRGLGDWIPGEMIFNNPDDPLGPERRMVETLKQRLMNRQEKRTADLVFVASAYDSTNKTTLSGNGQWSDSASDPIGALLTAIDAMLVMPNTLVLGSETWQKLRIHPKVVAACRPTGGNAASGGVVTRAELAEVLELGQVLVGKRRLDTAAPGAAPSYSRIWGKHALLAFVEPNPAIDVMSLAWTFSQRETNPLRRVDPEMGEAGALYVRESWNEDTKMVAKAAGYFFENAVA